MTDALRALRLNDRSRGGRIGAERGAASADADVTGAPTATATASSDHLPNVRHAASGAAAARAVRQDVGRAVAAIAGDRSGVAATARSVDRARILAVLARTASKAAALAAAATICEQRRGGHHGVRV